DAVMPDRRGFVPETHATHLFLVTAGRLATPAALACPEGITRAAVLDLAAQAGLACRVGDLSMTDFYNAGEVFVTGTMGGLVPVIEIDGRVIGRQARSGDRPADGSVRGPDRPVGHAPGVTHPAQGTLSLMAEAVAVPASSLPGGVEMPMIGFGTWQLRGRE